MYAKHNRPVAVGQSTSQGKDKAISAKKQSLSKASLQKLGSILFVSVLNKINASNIE